MNSYTLSRQWFAFAFENPSKVKPIHGSIYFWLVELANRLGWPAEFGNPGSQCMAACGISSYNTYKKAFDELAEFGFIEVKRKSVNQYSSCIIALSILDNTLYKALDKALATHPTKHLQSTGESTIQSTDSINKPITTNPLNLEPLNSLPALFELENPDSLTAKKEKPKEKSCGKKEKVTAVDFGDFDTPEFRAKWQEFLEYRKRIKAPITTSESEQRTINKLTAYDIPFAIKLIEATIDSGKWKGVVFDDTPQKYRTYLDNQSRYEQPSNTFGQKQQPGNKPTGAELAYLIAS